MSSNVIPSVTSTQVESITERNAFDDKIKKRYTSNSNAEGAGDDNETVTSSYICKIDIAFPSEEVSRWAKDVFSVDKEIGLGVEVLYDIIKVDDDSDIELSEGYEGVGRPREQRVLRVSIRANDAKSLRVSASSFYDMLNVFCRCHQEFSKS